MTFFGRDRVAEDLERIRRANLPPDQLAQLEEKEKAERERFAADRPGSRDIFAMVVAVFSLIGPYALVFIGILLAFGLLFAR